MNTMGGAVLLLTLVAPLSSADVSGVAVELGASFGEFSVSNHGPVTSLNTTVVVERKENQKWVRTGGDEPSPQKSLWGHKAPALPPSEAQRENCGSPVDGKFCSSQCPGHCRLDGPPLRVSIASRLPVVTGKRPSPHQNLKRSNDAFSWRETGWPDS